MQTKILVTGTRGFVGRNLLEYFSAMPERYAVFSLSRTEVDLLDEKAVKAYFDAVSPELVIHCAKVGGTRKTGYDEGKAEVVAQNLRMFFNLQRAAKPETRLINIGSGAEYDRRAYRPKMGEEYFDSSIPVDPYGFSKYAISKYVDRMDSAVCLRAFGLYGRYEDYTYKFISNAIVKNLLGLPIVINQNVVFDYLWIGDFCRLVEQVLPLATQHRHYNITPSESVDLVSIANMVNSTGKKKSEIMVLNPGLNTEYTASNARLLKELGGFSFTSYAEGIRLLYAYYESNLGKLDLESVKQDPYLKFCKKA